MDKFYIYKPKYHDILMNMTPGEIYELIDQSVDMDNDCEMIFCVRNIINFIDYFNIEATEFISVNENRKQVLNEIINE